MSDQRPDSSDEKPPSERTRLRRYNWLGKYDRGTINEILDSSILCHVGYVIDGLPYVTPTNYWRVGDHVYWHGSSASRMLKAQSVGIPVCFTVARLDGIVFARAHFNHNVNFRSVMAFGVAEVIGEEEKRAALKTFTDRLAPGLWEHARKPTEQEWKATRIIRMNLSEASAKVREGPPIDDEEDYNLECWAGIIPLEMIAHPPEPDPRLRKEIALPPFIRDFKLR